MGKFSNFERKQRDWYPTIDPKAAAKLAPFVAGTFIEPCAGDGALIRLLAPYGLSCAFACDIEPMSEGIEKLDVLFFGAQLPPCDQIITNPPYEFAALSPMIDKFRAHAPTWLLLKADFAFKRESRRHMAYCSYFVNVGRLFWEENRVRGMEDFAWFRFNKDETETRFIA